MPTFANIYSVIWDDKKFRNLSLPAQVLFIHYVTHPHITLTGIYELNMDNIRPKYELKIATECNRLYQELVPILKPVLDEETMEKVISTILNYPKVRFEEVFNEVINKKMVMYDSEKELIFVIRRFRYLSSQRSPQVIKGVIKELNRQRHPFNNEFLKEYAEEFKHYQIFLNGIQLDEKELRNPQQLKVIKNVEITEERVVNFLTYKDYEPELIKETVDKMFKKEVLEESK